MISTDMLSLLEMEDSMISSTDMISLLDWTICLPIGRCKKIGVGFDFRVETRTL